MNIESAIKKLAGACERSPEATRPTTLTDALFYIGRGLERLSDAHAPVEQTIEDSYPHEDGDTILLGPGCFIDADMTVINYRRANFYREEFEPHYYLVEGANGSAVVRAASDKDAVLIARQLSERGFPPDVRAEVTQLSPNSRGAVWWQVRS